MNFLEIMSDIAHRNNGDCYIGVVGPVRVGKSTFIKRFMEKAVIPYITDEDDKKRAEDELPISGSGKTITTGEPKFVPANAIAIKAGDDYTINVRLIDCVGYIVEDSLGYLENGKMRLVKTPWFTEELPFDEAAKIGTEKVIKEHSTIGIMITTDGSFGDIKRESFISAEEKTVEELKITGKPFVIILNSSLPGDENTIELRKNLEKKYQVPVILKDVSNMEEKDATDILKTALEEFPITSIALSLPTWVANLSDDHYIKKSLNQTVEDKIKEAGKIKDINSLLPVLKENEFADDVSLTDVDLKTGIITITIDVNQNLYDKVLSELVGCEIQDKDELIKKISELTMMKKEYEVIGNALSMAMSTGYGVSSPKAENCKLNKPEIFKTGNRYGIKISSTAPTYHILRVDSQQSFEPILGNKEQAEYFLKTLEEAYNEDPQSLLEKELFGQKIKDIISSTLLIKVNSLPEPLKIKLQSIIKALTDKGKNNLIAFVF